MKILRTPDSQFDNLPDFDYEPNYTTIRDNDGTELRIHSVDVGPREADPILLIHGNPTWSYLYRHMIPILMQSGRRIIAVDLVGCGRSDKPFITLFGNKDPISRGYEKDLQAHVPGSRGQDHRILNGVGHFSPEEAPEELANFLLAFINAS